MTDMKWKILPVLLLSLLVVFTPFARTQKASAYSTQPPTCAGFSTDLGWNWKDALQSSSGWTANDQTHGYTVDNFPGSVLMFQVFGGGYSGDTIVQFNRTYGHSKFYQNTTGNYGFNNTTVTLTGGADSAIYFYWVNGSHTITTGGGNFTGATTAPAVGSSFDVKCVQFAYNYSYDSNYDIGQFNSEIAGQANACGTWDLVCKSSGFFTSLATDTFNKIKAVLSSIASIFVPDSAQVTSDFNDFNTFMQSKLGFLTYPVTFLASLFSAFAPDTSWCTTSSCTKSFGNFYGQPVAINLIAAKAAMVSYWDWFIAMVRGVTVLGLILAIRRKYISIAGGK